MSLEERFWSKVDKGKPEECWEWQGTRKEYDYGIFQHNKDWSRLAHRISVRLEGQGPANSNVLHNCDNPPCVNPNHLYLGDQQDNMDDAVERNRVNFGEEGSNAKLTQEQVQEINDKLHEGLGNSEIAEDYPVSFETISDIRCGVSWTHVDVENPYHKTYKPESPRDKLSIEDVRQIKGELEAGQKPKTIAEKFDVDASTVSRIKHGYNYENVEAEDIDKSDLEFAEKQGSKLSKSEVRQIKQKIKEGDLYQKEIAEQHGVSRTMITQISNGKRWESVEV